ncbi:MAG: lipid-transfer protein [Actinobacteria bacterium TMED172]|nr:lipid-transfer protein [Cellvibrionales bacterium]OUW33438.1 MAG: lipid-transfer protein [Actinobacteria bacterium TMED172]|tara:strand:+ start:23872 stop:24933 length:1062 start_codon:yes stop_codon:yes gene_type:complete
MREVAIVAYAQSPQVRQEKILNEVEMLMPVIEAALTEAAMTMNDIDFVCSGSCDYIAGGAFSFVGAVDALGATPSKMESHVEMDAAWALYESWLKIQAGEISSALIYGFGKSSVGDLPDVMSQQCDPYYLAPLWPDSISMAGLQASALLATGRYTERDFAEVVVDSRRKAKANPAAQLSGDREVEALLTAPYIASPLRRHDCCPITDGVSVLIITDKSALPKTTKKPVYIRGIDHRMEAHQLGIRTLSESGSTTQALAQAKLQAGIEQFDIAELYAPFSPQTLILKDALGLDDQVDINPSGGPLAGHIMMSAGLDRFGMSFRALQKDEVTTALAHATSGPCLQHNMVAILEAG